MFGKTSERSEQGYIFAPRAQTRSRLKAPSGAAVLGARYGVWNNTLPCLNFTQPALQGLSAYRQVRHIPYKEFLIY